jgi:chromosome segregation ATPase
MGEFKHINEAKALGYDELKRRVAIMQDDLNRDTGDFNMLKNALSELEVEQERIERKQEVEEQKSGYQLPKDYNELFDDQRANDEILSLVTQTIDQVSNYYEPQLASKDAENLRAIQELHNAYEEDLARLRDEIAELQEENNRMGEVNVELGKKLALKDEALEQEEIENDETVRLLNETKARANDADNRAKDAESKRDAAVREVESLKAQILELEQMTAKPKQKSFSLNLSSGIEDVKIKTSRELAMERYLQVPAIGGVATAETFPSNSDSSNTTDKLDADGSTEADAEVQGEAVTFPNDHASAGVPEGAAEADRGEMAYVTKEELERRLTQTKEEVKAEIRFMMNQAS